MAVLTNLPNYTLLVVTDNNDKVLGIVEVESGEQDITAQLEEVISDNDDYNFVSVLSDLEIEWATEVFEIDVELEDEDDDERYTNSFYFTAAELYKKK